MIDWVASRQSAKRPWAENGEMLFMLGFIREICGETTMSRLSVGRRSPPIGRTFRRTDVERQGEALVQPVKRNSKRLRHDGPKDRSGEAGRTAAGAHPVR